MTLGELRKEIARCAVVEGDLARLECFDALAQKLGLDGPQSKAPQIQGTGKWLVDVEENPIDDSTTVSLVLLADSGQSSWGTPIGLVLRCHSNKTEVFINWGEYLGSEAKVTARVGDTKAKTRTWGLSTDSKATFYPGGDITFIKELLETDRLVAQVTPYGESPVTAVFDLGGLPNAIKPLRETCGW